MIKGNILFADIRAATEKRPVDTKTLTYCGRVGSARHTSCGVRGNGQNNVLMVRSAKKSLRYFQTIFLKSFRFYCKNKQIIANVNRWLRKTRSAARR